MGTKGAAARKLRKLQTDFDHRMRDAVAASLACRHDAISISSTERETTVAFNYGVSIAYDELHVLAARLDTTSINLEYRAGWGGTEATPGDDSELTLVIGVGWGDYEPPSKPTKKGVKK